jgi:hypothetical protein
LAECIRWLSPLERNILRFIACASAVGCSIVVYICKATEKSVFVKEHSSTPTTADDYIMIIERKNYWE